ncbi:MAG: phosphoribosylaminoimidazolesuccinocarboxamide synthase [Oscillospiraceae bacterium]|nr:phosphoribosylaminoimidazolesuccinocarboxamide synthase [Oscillospiraceae bacterium]
MKLVYEGKTKTVYDLEDGYYMLKFKDDVTGTDGVFDPGANTVGLSIEGIGRDNLRLTEFFYKAINEAGFPTHFVSADIEKAEMIVLPAQCIGDGLEVICRYRAVGSFLRRYGGYVQNGQELDALVEITLKDDERGDPPISRDALEMLGIMDGEQYDSLKTLTKMISGLVKDILASKGMELYDIKLEFGRVEDSIVLIDEISGGNMRAYKDGQIVDPLDLVGLLELV